MKRALLAPVLAVATVLSAAPAGAAPAVDPDRYRTDGGGYAFTYRYDGATRACTITADPTTVRCGISAPAGTRITVRGRSIRPEAVEITERGWRFLERRPGAGERRDRLPQGARLSVHGASCTALRDGGLECAVDAIGFRQVDGTFATRGRKAA
ncbi:hypothetical protein [Tsukamurella sp. PLM1]|uniref:hypothetical protein n=1 Tax=Tsukamurella sp. PLM1 TaxID=2929795 RepID=UPI002045CBB6|nr:hypothetical protein [Tsukamurella sp. PLM1]BDH57695.1 hypothetical protein MTP03_26340 [Tsukamurella sp. PLM1]